MNNCEYLDKREKYIIIGGSGAGMGAAVEIRKRDKESDIIIISKEDVKGYYRPRLSKILSDSNITIQSISIKKNEWYEKNNVKVMLNREVEKIEPKNKKVVFTDGNNIEYTKLIIASGAEVFVPPIIGRNKKGVFTLRYAKDVKNIKEYANGKKTAAVIGGGILGLEMADGLNKLGLKVTVLEMSERILSRQLDADASNILEEKIDEAGVRFRTNATTKEIKGDDKVSGILLNDGETIEAELVIISTGVRANSKIVEGSGIEVNKAIVVNEKMETTFSNIYACGDCAEYNGINYALWSEALEQGKVAGVNAAGDKYIYEQIIPSTTMKAFNTSVFSIGDIGTNNNKDYDEFEINNDRGYKKMYFLDGVLSGGILIGDTSKSLELKRGFEKSKTLKEMIEMFKA